MQTSDVGLPSTGQRLVDGSRVRTDATWKPLYRVGALAALIIVLFIPVQSIIYILWPPPHTVSGYFTLFQRNWLLGLLSFDLLYIVDNVLLALIYLALYVLLRRISASLVTIALVLGLVGITAYFTSNPAFEMLSLSNQYAAATSDAQRLLLLAAGQALFESYTGTAFDVYYILNAVVTVIFSVVMLRSAFFSKIAAYAGIAAGVLMFIPSSAGVLGLYFSFASLIPFAIWAILIARRLFQLAGSN